MDDASTILTVGHSNRTATEFLDLLERHGVETLVDIRRFAGSRRLPHFGSDRLNASLADRAIRYLQLPGLGGRRRAGRDQDPDRLEAVAGAWRNASFRAYAAHVQSDEYARALAELRELARGARCAIMCSEAVPWRCHRWLVSDTLVAAGDRVLHALSQSSLREHELTSFARVRDGHVTWPGPESDASLRLGPERDCAWSRSSAMNGSSSS